MVIVTCPHCGEPIIIIQINCGIFRHGVLIKSGKQMDPHLNQIECEKLINKKLIYGCGKPFQIIKKSDIYETVVCDYI
jgi:hypothetical protein